MLSRVVSLDFFGSFGLMPVGLAFAAGIAASRHRERSSPAGALISAAMIAVDAHPAVAEGGRLTR